MPSQNSSTVLDHLKVARDRLGSGAVWRGGTGVPPVNHAQDARATFKLHHYLLKGARPMTEKFIWITTRALALLFVIAILQLGAQSNSPLSKYPSTVDEAAEWQRYTVDDED